MTFPRAILFDLDDTLAPSFEAPAPAMIRRLVQLVARVPLVIITGRSFDRIEPNFLPLLAPHAPSGDLFVMPESSAMCLVWDGSQWIEQYSTSLSEDERSRIRTAIGAVIAETNALDGLPVFGERLLEKRAQIALAALGLDVPSDLKYSWDPDNVRRTMLRDAIAARLPEFDVLFGGATSIDITHKGVNKACGVRWLSEHLQVNPCEMLYIGDALYPGGNDFVVIETSVATRTTTGVEETARIIDELLVAWDNSIAPPVKDV
jgi:HAD superfamily hydrolase (TIGR01484 family)